MNTTKAVGYSYPTSPNAKRFGFYQSGCFVVEIHSGNLPEYLAGYATKAEAFAHAETLPQPYNRYSIKP